MNPTDYLDSHGALDSLESLSPLSQSVYNVISKTLGEKAKKVLLLSVEWHEIIGTELSPYITLSRIKPYNTYSGTFTVYIETPSPLATHIQHQIPLIRKKINQFLGEEAIQNILIKQKTWKPTSINSTHTITKHE